MGVTSAGLDVRVARYGNFGDSEAADAAAMFARVARILGVEPVVFLTDASHAYQPGIGRGESLQALDAPLLG